jgi:hypothetical protein
MRYDYLRIFLLEDQQLEFPGFSTQEPLSRTAFLHYVLSRRIDFIHRKSKFVYVPIGQAEIRDGVFYLGRIGRSIREIENAPPEESFAEQLHTSWRAANIIVDSRDFFDGQKLAFQSRGDIGRPLPIAESFGQHLNRQFAEMRWHIFFNSIFEPQEFWTAVEQYRGTITQASFTFTTPNILKIRSKINEELKEAREKNNAQRATKILENDEGELNLESEEVEDSLQYISEGGGKVLLKKGKKTIFNSKKSAKEIYIESDKPLRHHDLSGWRLLIEEIFF